MVFWAQVSVAAASRPAENLRETLAGDVPAVR
jgi:hypothetical protein